MLEIYQAGAEAAEDVRFVRAEAAAALTRDHGAGHWSVVSTLRTIRKHAADGRVFAAENDGNVIGTFVLSHRKIGFYRQSWFEHPRDPACYLTDMAILPSEQRRGVGSQCMREIERLAQERELLAVRLDAYAGDAGAGAFYRKCGYRRVHCGRVRAVALEYYEKSLR